MTNKEIIREVNQGFSTGDHDKIMKHVDENVRWEVVGFSTAVGKEAFLKEVKNENFIGLPTITVKNELEENDLVAVEGEVMCTTKNGETVHLLFFDFYKMENGKIKEMRSYLVPKK